MYFFSNIEFNGRIIHSFIHRNEYITGIYFSENYFYEIVIKKNIDNPNLICNEVNYFGYMVEMFTVNYNDENLYFFVVNTFDPKYVDQQFDPLAGNIKYTQHTFNIKDIRRLYAVWPLLRANA